MINLMQLLKVIFPAHPATLENDGIEPYPENLEFILGAIFVFVIGFLGVQKILQVFFNPESAINVNNISESACNNGFRFSFLDCPKTNSLKQLESVTSEPIESQAETEKIMEDVPVVSKYSLIQGMDESHTALPLRQQFASLPNLSAALDKLKWDDNDSNLNEQDAVRLLTIASTLEYGRQREAHLVQSSMTRLLNPLWNSYPDLVAASHCLYCGSFFNNVLKPFMSEGTENKEHLEHLAAGHPRFLNAIFQSGQIDASKINDIAILQAELSSSGDADTAKFIGNILIKENEIELLHQWSTKGWNGSYVISDNNNFTQLPRNIIIDAWQRSVSRGSDNAVLTRYLISTGHRPALRWLLWYHSGNLSYFKKRQFKIMRDKYNDFLTKNYIDFPKKSYNDLTGFYSKNWKNIIWDQVENKWSYKP